MDLPPEAVRERADGGPDDAVVRTIARLLVDRERRGDTARVVSILRRRNRFSDTAIVEIATPATERLFVKVLPRRDAWGADCAAERARQVAAEAALLAEMRRRGIRAPRFVAAFPDDFALVTTVCPGTPLLDALTSPGRRLVPPALARRAAVLAESCAAWLARFHAAISPPPLDAALDALFAYVRDRLRLLAAADPARFGAARTGRIERFFERFARALTESASRGALARGAAPVVIHNDFTPRNVLVAGGEPTVVDFSGHGPGFREDDLRRFARSVMRHLDGGRIVRPPLARVVARRLEARFRRAYRAAGGKTLGTGHPATRLVLLKHALAEALGALGESAADRGPLGRRRARRRYARLVAELDALLGRT
jgi:aminoglycoside phosphotransferase (APT) family kinase protein